ncbi:hypothetical protein DIPPA_31026 [Diplonema papillatum]|nr:hypothetical protein DIPPA_31026 [Diplonema papillatum]
MLIKVTGPDSLMARYNRVPQPWSVDPSKPLLCAEQIQRLNRILGTDSQGLNGIELFLLAKDAQGVFQKKGVVTASDTPRTLNVQPGTCFWVDRQPPPAPAPAPPQRSRQSLKQGPPPVAAPGGCDVKQDAGVSPVEQDGDTPEIVRTVRVRPLDESLLSFDKSIKPCVFPEPPPTGDTVCPSLSLPRLTMPRLSTLPSERFLPPNTAPSLHPQHSAADSVAAASIAGQLLQHLEGLTRKADASRCAEKESRAAAHQAASQASAALAQVKILEQRLDLRFGEPGQPDASEQGTLNVTGTAVSFGTQTEKKVVGATGGSGIGETALQHGHGSSGSSRSSSPSVDEARIVRRRRGDWIEVWDPKLGRYYYANDASGQTQWEPSGTAFDLHTRNPAQRWTRQTKGTARNSGSGCKRGAPHPSSSASSELHMFSTPRSYAVSLADTSVPDIFECRSLL